MNYKLYRILEKDEIIQEGDEVDSSRNPFKDDPAWQPAKNIGEKAPDPKYLAHCLYRRLISEGKNLDDVVANKGLANCKADR